MNNNEISNLDQEWLMLIKEAMEIGINKDEIRTFLSINQEPLLVKNQQKPLE